MQREHCDPIDNISDVAVRAKRRIVIRFDIKRRSTEIDRDLLDHANFLGCDFKNALDPEIQIFSLKIEIIALKDKKCKLSI
jgi:hypothetical protein